ncbi:MAG: 1,4-dihydroxy-2-naphthoate polyprenyltransferase [Verrucomicrobiota bacterium]
MLKDWIEAARPKTLAAAVVPIAVGAAEAYRFGIFNWWPVFVCLAFALLVQIGTNMANDYYDFVKGADGEDRLGPERLVSSGRIQPKAMFWVSIAVFAIAFLVGLNLVWYRGWELLAVGLISIVFGYGYTGGPFPLAYHGLGDVFVILFFGLIATMGTFYVLVGVIEWPVALLGGALGLLANNILVVNNYRDRETDAAAGKRTVIVRRGAAFGIRQYRIQFDAAFVLIGVFAAMKQAWWVCLAFAILPLGFKLMGDLKKTEGKALNGVLAKTAALLLVTGLLLSFGLWLEGWLEVQRAGLGG